MPQYRISFLPDDNGTSDTPLTIEAEYYQHASVEGSGRDWTTFKDVNGKVIADIPSAGIRMIGRIKPEATPKAP